MLYSDVYYYMTKVWSYIFRHTQNLDQYYTEGKNDLSNMTVLPDLYVLINQSEFLHVELHSMDIIRFK